MRLMDQRKDVECLTNHIRVISEAMRHAHKHMDPIQKCAFAEIWCDIQKDLYVQMKLYTPELAAEVGPPPDYECTCGFHEGGTLTLDV